MPLRVLHFIGQIGVGGCEKQLLEFSRRIDRTKLQFGLCYYSPHPASMDRDFEEAGVRLFYVNKFGGISKPRFVQTLRRFVREFEPDIIHTWQYSANVWGRLTGLTCGYRRFVSSERSARPYGWYMWVLERILGRQTVWTANTAAVAETITRYLGVSPDRIHVFHNGVDIPRLDREECRAAVRNELGLRSDCPIVLTVGRQTPAKNYPMFFRTARRVVSQRPEVVCVSAGHGEQESALRRLHDEMELGGSVRMLGLRHDVPRLMAAADLFCLCSDWEGFPNVLVEAMASGLPVVTTGFAGVHEIVDHPGPPLCRMVDCGQDDRMAEQIVDLLADRDAGAQMAEAARTVATQRFGWGRLLASMERFYEAFAQPGPIPSDAKGRACTAGSGLPTGEERVAR